MANSKPRQTQINIIWSLFQLVVNLGISFGLTSFITENIGVEAYGFVSLTNTMITYINIISVALNSFAAKYVSFEYYNGRKKEANIYRNSILVANIILGCIVLFPAIILIKNLESIIFIPEYLETDVKILFLFMVLNYVITIVQTAFSISIFICNRLDITYKTQALTTIMKALLLVLLYTKLPGRIYYVGIATLISSLVLLLIIVMCSNQFLPELKVSLRKKDVSVLAIITLISKGVWNSLNSLGNTLNSGLDLIVTNQYLSSVAMGQLSISKRLLAIISTLNAQIASVFQPKQMEAYAKGDKESLVCQLKVSMRISSFLGEVIIGGFTAVGLDFLGLWIPSQNIKLIYIITLLCMFGDLVVGSVTPLYYVYTMTGKIRLPSIVTIVNGVFNVAMMLILFNTTDWGLYGVVITTIICNFVLSFIWTPIYSSSCLSVSKKTFYPEIFRHLIVTFVLIAIQLQLVRYAPSANTWIALIAKSLVVGFVECIFLLLCHLSKEEIKGIYRRIAKM